MKRSFVEFEKLLALIAVGLISIGACVEFYHVAWGTGEAVGQFSPRWLVLFCVFVLFCLALLTAIVFSVFEHNRFFFISRQIISIRSRLSFLR